MNILSVSMRSGRGQEEEEGVNSPSARSAVPVGASQPPAGDDPPLIYQQLLMTGTPQ